MDKRLELLNVNEIINGNRGPCRKARIYFCTRMLFQLFPLLLYVKVCDWWIYFCTDIVTAIFISLMCNCLWLMDLLVAAHYPLFWHVSFGTNGLTSAYRCCCCPQAIALTYHCLWGFAIQKVVAWFTMICDFFPNVLSSGVDGFRVSHCSRLRSLDCKVVKII